MKAAVPFSLQVISVNIEEDPHSKYSRVPRQPGCHLKSGYVGLFHIVESCTELADAYLYAAP